MKILPLLILAIFALAGCNEPEMESAWTDRQVVIDGHAEDWKGIPLTFFEDAGAVVGFTNDSEKVSILVRFRQAAAVRGIRMTGLTLWLDPDGKKREDFMLRYHGGPSPEELVRYDTALAERISPEMRERLADGMRPPGDKLVCAIKNRIVEMEIDPDGENGPKAAFAIDQGLFTYEFSVPLDSGEVRYYGLGASPGRMIAIGARWGGRPQSRGGESMGRPGGDSFGGFGGGPGGGRGRPGGFGSGPARQLMPSETKVWLKVNLAAGTGATTSQ